MTARVTVIVQWAEQRKPAGSPDYQFFEVHAETSDDALAKAEKVIRRFGSGLGVIVWPQNATGEPVVRLSAGGELSYDAFLREYGLEVGLTGPVA